VSFTSLDTKNPKLASIYRCKLVKILVLNHSQ